MMTRNTRTLVVLLTLFAIEELVFGIPVDEIYRLNVTGCPRIVTRDEWKARKPRKEEQLHFSPAPYVVVHHGGMRQYCYDQETCSKIVRSYQDLHIDDRGWFDIGYSFVIGEDGNVYEGRGWNKVGAHAPGYNFKSIGICVIGDFTDDLPNAEALRALQSLISCGISLGKINEDYKLIGHRQARTTECPGNTFFKYVTKLPHWTSQPVASFSLSTTTKVPPVLKENDLEIDYMIDKAFRQ